MRVLFYISGHGYGHATRMAAVMSALVRLDPELKITVRTEAPEWVFRTSAPGSVTVEKAWIDSGVIEKDLLAQDIPATLARAEALFAEADRIVAEETELVRRRGFDRIVSDIPPLASRIGAAAAVPVIAVGNFTWEEIYAPFLGVCPGHVELLGRIRACYEQTDLLLQLPWSLPMEPFPHRKHVPLIARTPTEERDSTRLDLYRAGVPDDRPLVLLGGRFPNLDGSVLESILASDRFTILSFGGIDAAAHPRHCTLGTDWQPRFVNVLQAADAVVTKIGYGIASETAASRTRVLYPPRELFAEQDAIEPGLAEIIPIRRISRAQFEAGEWMEPLEELLAMPQPAKELDTSGAEAAARAIVAF